MGFSRFRLFIGRAGFDVVVSVPGRSSITWDLVAERLRHRGLDVGRTSPGRARAVTLVVLVAGLRFSAVPEAALRAPTASLGALRSLRVPMGLVGLVLLGLLGTVPNDVATLLLGTAS